MATVLLFKNEPRRPAGDSRTEERHDTVDDTGRVLVCADCLHAITTAAARVERTGSHAHTFTNPYGLVFRIGCFSTAPGCDAGGDPTTEHTWFPGFAWQLAACRGCGGHMGWLFTASEARFHGLILGRLVETEAHGPGS